MKLPRKARALAWTLLASALLAVPAAALVQEEPRAAGTDVPVPKRTKFVQPQYPAEALAQGLRGIVILSLTIGVSGKVEVVDVVRSLPPFDEPAVSAARQWEYEVTRVDGKPVPVRLTVPITFALKLPEMDREPGIPELRQGVTPSFPPDPPSRETTTVVADLTVDPAGQVLEAEVTSGAPPWSESLLLALRTWRFTPPGGDHSLSFQVRADFVSSGRGAPRVQLKLTGLRHGEAPPPAEVAASAAPESPTTTPPDSAPPAQETSPPPPGPASPAPQVPPAATPAEPASPAPSGAPGSPLPAPVGAPGAPGSTPDTAPSPPSASPGQAAPPPSSSPPANPSAPPVEIIPPAIGLQPAPAPTPPPRPAEPGVSAVQDVVLGPGVPDLSTGRRPVVPPLARMSGISGSVEVRFSVEASGATAVREVTGPEALKEAARQAVASWKFRRTTPDRLPMVAVLSYLGDAASASVKLLE